nr:serine/threonine-protein kinase STY13-like [Ipomoea batatas]
MEKSSDDFVRADQIDLKSLDEQLERHLNRAWTLEIEEQEEADAGRFRYPLRQPPRSDRRCRPDRSSLCVVFRIWVCKWRRTLLVNLKI